MVQEIQSTQCINYPLPSEIGPNLVVLAGLTSLEAVESNPSLWSKEVHVGSPHKTEMIHVVVVSHSLDPCLCGGSPIIPPLVHQPAYPSIWPVAPSHHSNRVFPQIQGGQCGAYVDTVVMWVNLRGLCVSMI